MMQPRPDRLEVYYGSDRVGTVHDSMPLAFEYAPGWLDGTQRMTLAAISLQSGMQTTPAVQAFFENLLPEGELRDYLAAQRKASTLFSLLLEVAGDTTRLCLPNGKSERCPSRLTLVDCRASRRPQAACWRRAWRWASCMSASRR
jgi:serine/threonine-protein kinase HipA